MSAARALAEAIRALVPAGVTHHPGHAPTGARPPWVVSNQSAPAIVERSEAGGPTARVGRVRLNFSGASEDAVLAVMDTVLPALEGARVTVAGWSTSPLRMVGEPRIYPDEPTLTATGRLMVGAAAFEYTVTAIPS